MRRILLAFLLSLFAVPAFTQARHPFTFEDMMKLKRLGEPEVSPDEKWVIFSVVDVDLEANSKTPHIWIVPATGGQEREIIADQDADRPRWAPDGKRFAFLSTKGGESQIWIANFDSGAGAVTGVQKLTSIATEAGGELWSPDGKTILFTSDVYPECDGEPAAELQCNAKTLEERKNSNVKAQIFTHLLYRHWNAYKEGTRTHIFVVRVDACPGDAGQGKSSRSALDRTVDGGCQYIDLTPGDYDAPVFSLGGQDDYAFSPDGKEICYASNHDKNPAASTNNDLWIVPVNAGTDHVGTAASAVPTEQNDYVTAILAQTKNITADNPASDSTPLYSPDGRYIAYRAQQRPGYEADRFRLMLYDRKTGEKKNLTENFDQWVGTFTWMPDSKGFYFNAESNGEAPLYQLDVKSSKLPKEVVRRFNDDPTVTPDGTALLFTRMSLSAPTEIFTTSVLDFAGKGAPAFSTGCTCAGTSQQSEKSSCSCSDVGRSAAQFTHFNDALFSQIDMQPLESFWFPGAHRDKVQGFLVKPPNFDASKKYPVKFLIHGGPQGAWGDDWSYRWNAELFAAPTSGQPS